MSFRNTKTPAMSGKKAKWQVPRRVDKCVGCPKYYLEGEIKERFTLLKVLNVLTSILLFTYFLYPLERITVSYWT